jgi:predicted secreted hydrolase
MKMEQIRKNKRGATDSRIKEILSFFIIIIMIAPTIPVQAAVIGDHDYEYMLWKHYPYHPPGTDIVFPADEGSHDTKQYPIEWWYANFHLTGVTTGKEYGSFLAFYKIQTTVAEKQELRIFSISDITAEKMYTNAHIGTLIASTDHLDLSFKYVTNTDENTNLESNQMLTQSSIIENQEKISKTETVQTAIKPLDQNAPIISQSEDNTKTTIGNTNDTDEKNTDESLTYEYWSTKTNGQDLLPFEYTLLVSGTSQQDSQPMKLAVDMNCLKKPLIVGGDGIVSYGDYGYSYYYSLTRLDVVGLITLNEITEEVNGYAWIDHQWGNFIIQNPPPYGLTLTYEWFSIQFNDNQEIIVGDAWNRKTDEKIDQSYTGGLNLLNSDGSSELLKDYTITPQECWDDIQDHRFYNSKWHITEPTKSIDFIVTPIFIDQVMRLEENYPSLQTILEELFPGACFWEGICTISGTIDGFPVSGKAYVELTHYSSNGDNIDSIPSERYINMT